MTELQLYVPKAEDGWFYEKMMSDPATMAYNAPWFPPDGCIPDPAAEWDRLQAGWIGQEPQRFYAFLRRSADGAFVGDVNYHYTPERDWWDMGVLIYAPERGKGYGRQGLRLLVEKAFSDGVRTLHNDFEPTRHAAYQIHRAVGFREVGRADGLVQLELTRDEYRTPGVTTELRRVRKGDEAALAYIQTESWKAAFAGILDAATLEKCTSLEKATAMYRRLLEEGSGNGYLLSVDGKPHCIAYWDAARDAELAGKAELICIHSLPGNWHRGYGSQMMDRVLADIRAAGYSEAVLWVFRENHRARAFYEAKGFTVTDFSKPLLGAEELLYSIALERKQSVSLRPMTAEMYHAYYRAYKNDPDLFIDKRECKPFVYSPAWVDRYIRRQIDCGRTCLAVMYGEEMAGEIILKNVEPGRSATLSICMKNDRYKGRGIGTQAERLAIDYVFHTLDIPVLYADTVVTNTRSQHVLEKLGFQLLRTEGDFKYYAIERRSERDG